MLLGAPYVRIGLGTFVTFREDIQPGRRGSVGER